MRVVEQKCNCGLKIMPLTDYPKITTLYNPTWEESGVLTLIYKVEIDGTQKLIDMNIAIHVIDNKPRREVYELSNISDGWYKIISYIVPTKESLMNLGMVDKFDDLKYQSYWKENSIDNVFKQNTDIIVACTEKGFCFLGRQKNPSPSTSSGLYSWLNIDNIDDLLDEIQNRGIDSENYIYGTNIKVISEDYFSYCNLYKCFINKATQLLDSYKGCSKNGTGICSSNLKCKSNIDQYSIQIRDYIWMVLNAIKYAIECKDYLTANRLLNCINTCSGICNNGTATKSDCGCP